jgi:hypothetical protein
LPSKLTVFQSLLRDQPASILTYWYPYGLSLVARASTCRSRFFSVSQLPRPVGLTPARLVDCRLQLDQPISGVSATPSAAADRVADPGLAMESGVTVPGGARAGVGLGDGPTALAGVAPAMARTSARPAPRTVDLTGVSSTVRRYGRRGTGC